MPDWLSLGSNLWPRADLLSLGQLVFTVLGFAVAIGQLRRTALATEEMNRELRSLQTRYASNDLLVALPGLQTLEDELESALKSGRQDSVERTLAAYVRSATEIVAVIESRDDLVDDKLLKSLPPLVKAATRLRAELSKGVAPDLPAVVTPVLQKMYGVSPEISSVVARLQRKVEN